VRGLLAKYPANKLNPYREKVISALRAKDKWLCEEQFLATFATLILKKSFSGSCSSDFRRKFFGNIVAILSSLMSRFPEACVMNALIVFVSSRKESS